MAKTLLIVGHVPSPNTATLRDAVERGARALDAEGLEVRALSPFDTTPEDVLAADAIVLGTTENLGYMSGALKDFFDRCYYPVLEEKQGLPCAVYIRARLDGTGTKRAIESILAGLRWRLVQDIAVFHGEWQAGSVEQAEQLGQLMAAGLEAGVF
jgi:multimeric flavodoxin WrbA